MGPFIIIYGGNITKQGCSYHGLDRQVRGDHDECVGQDTNETSIRIIDK